MLLWLLTRNNSMEAFILSYSLKGCRPSWGRMPTAGAWSNWPQCFWIQITEKGSRAKDLTSGLLPPDLLPPQGSIFWASPPSKTVPPAGGPSIQKCEPKADHSHSSRRSVGGGAKVESPCVPRRNLSVHSLFLICQSHNTKKCVLGSKWKIMPTRSLHNIHNGLLSFSDFKMFPTSLV